MGNEDKLLKEFINTPFPTWKDVESLLKKLGYKKLEGSGSRVKFINLEIESAIDLHRPHPGNTIKAYMKKSIIKELTDKGFIK